MHYGHDKCICTSARLSTTLEYTKAITISIELALIPNHAYSRMKKVGEAMAPLTPVSDTYVTSKHSDQLFMYIMYLLYY